MTDNLKQASSDHKKDSKKFKKEKIKRLQEKLDLEASKCKEYLDRLKYLQADFENYRKRAEKENQTLSDRVKEIFVSNLLVLLDDLELILERGETSNDINPILDGVKMVYKKFQSFLEQEGLKRLDVLGELFNPCKHEILAKIETEEYRDGTIIEEVRKGFLFKDKIIRPSIVKVASKLDDDKLREVNKKELYK